MINKLLNYMEKITELVFKLKTKTIYKKEDKNDRI